MCVCVLFFMFFFRLLIHFAETVGEEKGEHVLKRDKRKVVEVKEASLYF